MKYIMSAARRSLRRKAAVDYSKLENEYAQQLKDVEGLSDLTDNEVEEDDDEGFKADNVSDENESEEVENNNNFSDDGDNDEIMEDADVADIKEDNELQGVNTKNKGTPKKKPSSARLLPFIDNSIKRTVTRERRKDTVKDRVLFLYGSNLQLSIELIKKKIEWQQFIYMFPDSMLKSDNNNNAIIPNGYDFEIPVETPLFLNSISKSIVSNTPDEVVDEMMKIPPLKLRLGFNQEEVWLKSHQIIQLSNYFPQSDILGSIINANKYITCVKWLPGFNDKKQYLSVSILGKDLDNSSIVDPSLSMFPKLKEPSSSSNDNENNHRKLLYPFSSTLMIYEIDTTTGKTELTKGFCFNINWGAHWSLDWRPVSESNSNEVVCSAVFSDGLLRVFSLDLSHNTNIDTTNESNDNYINEDLQSKFEIISSPSREFNLGDIYISCATWRTLSAIAVGTANGEISEFDLEDTSEVADRPSFLVPIHESYIYSISTAFPEKSNLIFTTSTDGYQKICDTNDLQSLVVSSSRTKEISSVTAYSQFLHSFIGVDSTSVKFYPILAIKHGNLLTTHCGSISTAAVSPHHPFIISSGADGDVILANSARRAFGSGKTMSKIYSQISLYTLEYSEKENTYRYLDWHKAEKLIDFQKKKSLIFPYNNQITALSWNPNREFSNWFASGSACGLIRIQKLETSLR